MTPSADEIEDLVRKVVASLMQHGGSNSVVDNSLLVDSSPTVIKGVISIDTIRARKKLEKTLVVEPRAVITPSALDYCRDQQIQIVRQSMTVGDRSVPTSPLRVGPNSVLHHTSSQPSYRNPSPIVVAGMVPWMRDVAKQLCSEESKVVEPLVDDQAVINRLIDLLSQGHRAAIALVASPHAICLQAARDEKLRPAVVSNWLELGDILREMPTNLLVLSSKSWNVASTCNVARRLSHFVRAAS
jgi:hypothetical protein